MGLARTRLVLGMLGGLAIAGTAGAEGPSRLGITAVEVVDLDPGPADVPGLLVREVDPRGAAARAGIGVGDVVVAVGEERVEGLEQAREALGQAGATVRLEVLDGRTGALRDVAIGPGAGSRDSGQVRGLRQNPSTLVAGRLEIPAGASAPSALARQVYAAPVVAATDGRAWRLDFGGRRDLLLIALRLNGRDVLVAGTPLPGRKTLLVTALQPSGK